jgi:hypothetical protein
MRMPFPASRRSIPSFRCTVQAAVLGAVLSAAPWSSAATGAEFAVTSPLPENAQWFATYYYPATPQTLLTPSGKLVTLGFNTKLDAMANDSTEVRVVDPATGLARGWRSLTVPTTVGSAYAVASCGTGECLAVAIIKAGTVQLQRLSLDAMAWLDPAPVPVSNVLNDTPNGGVTLASDGSSYLVCWSDVAGGATQTVLKCVTTNGSLTPVGTEAALGPYNGTAVQIAAQPGVFAISYGTKDAWTATATVCDPAQAGATAYVGFIKAATGQVMGTPTKLGVPGAISYYGNVATQTLLAESGGFIAIRLGATTRYTCAARFDSGGAPAGMPFSLDIGAAQAGFVAGSVGTRGTVVTYPISSAHLAYELAPGATTLTPHTELPPQIAAHVGDGAFVAYVHNIDVYGIDRGVKYATLWAFDAGSSMYALKYNLPLATNYAVRRDVDLAYDNMNDSFFVGWLDVGSQGPTPSSPAYTDAALMVNVFAPGATTPKNPSPLALRPGGAFSFPVNSATPLGKHATWAIDAALGNALVAYIAANTTGQTILVGQRIKADGTWLDAAPVALANLTGVGPFFMTHGPTLYFVTYGTPPNTTTISIDAAAATLTPVVMPAGTLAPFGPPVGSTLLAVGSATGPSVVDATTLAIMNTVSEANWNPKPEFPNEAFYYSGSTNFSTFYPAAAGGGAPCGRIGADGSFTNGVSCNLPVGNFLVMVGPRPPSHVVSATNGALLYVDVKNIVHQWFEGTGTSGSDMPFPAPTRTLTATGGPPQGTSQMLNSYLSVAGGHMIGLTAYLGNWTSSTGEIAGDVYARWIQPGFSGGVACTKDQECQSLSCLNMVCTQPAQPGGGDAGTAASDGGATPADSGSSTSGPPDSSLTEPDSSLTEPDSSLTEPDSSLKETDASQVTTDGGSAAPRDDASSASADATADDGSMTGTLTSGDAGGSPSASSSSNSSKGSSGGCSASGMTVQFGTAGVFLYLPFLLGLALRRRQNTGAIR